jgi:hypothetical protein
VIDEIGEDEGRESESVRGKGWYNETRIEVVSIVVRTEWWDGKREAPLLND